MCLRARFYVRFVLISEEKSTSNKYLQRKHSLVVNAHFSCARCDSHSNWYLICVHVVRYRSEENSNKTRSFHLRAFKLLCARISWNILMDTFCFQKRFSAWVRTKWITHTIIHRRRRTVALCHRPNSIYIILGTQKHSVSSSSLNTFWITITLRIAFNQV